MRKKGFIHNTITLVGGNMLAQIITIAFVPVITRIYTPESFGQFSSMLAISVVLAAVSSLRYTAAIQLPHDSAKSDALTVLCTALVIAFSLIVTITIFVFDDDVIKYFSLQNQAYAIYFLPIMVLITGLKFVLDSWYLREEGFRVIAVSLVSGATCDRFVTIITGLTYTAGSIGLLVGKTSGLLLSIMTLSVTHKGRSLCAALEGVKRTEIQEVAKKYKQFPIYSWSALVQQLTTQLPVILLGIVFSPAIVGYYALAKRILIMPGSIVGTSLSKSFYQKMSNDLRNGKDLRGPTLKLFKTMLLYIVIPVAVFSTVADDLFSLVFGDAWREAGIYIKAIAPMTVAIFIIRPLSVFFDLFEKQKEQSIFNVVVLITGAAVLLTIGKYTDAYTTILVFSLTSTAIIGYRCVLLLGYAGIDYGVSIRLVLSYVATGASITWLSYILQLTFGVHPAITASVIILTYTIYLYTVDPYAKKLINIIIKKSR
jgi:O-antigen/teichoic acid export membrane protein